MSGIDDAGLPLWIAKIIGSNDDKEYIQLVTIEATGWALDREIIFNISFRFPEMKEQRGINRLIEEASSKIKIEVEKYFDEAWSK